MAGNEFVLYHYNPSFITAVIFITLFSASAALHLYQLVRWKTAYFIPFLIGCIFEAAGYAGRAVSSKQSPNWAVLPYVVQSLLLLLGPTFLAASIYMVLGRVVKTLEADSYSRVHPSILAKVFVLGDIISFLAQSGGGGILANAKTADAEKRGRNIIIFGLIVQIYFFGFFINITSVFHKRIVSNPTAKYNMNASQWRKCFLVLYTTSAFIMMRSIFRIAEYIGGSNSTLQSTEVYIYIFDAAPMCLVVTLFNIFHPSQIISKGQRAPDECQDLTRRLYMEGDL